ncbi:gluconate 2-dehydrogenase subunit 3 family protein [Mycolicibacterium mengxianglii]|uniref:gluconate 2-dehydrogenase subunit 3 family protein n=1 Tax=Mycolicibacterium mengxianglii TaxID=2736649 RepID=UPI0018D0CAB2|nr:gluconate 2-dehydrogenase subunit 3 family protein [Mycolicibacterium mengxianglii]
MSNDEDLTPAPLGAPAVGTDRPDQPHFEAGRPRLGGLADPIVFSEAETKVLGALADTIVPPGEDFPAPSEVGIVEFFGRYTTPTGFRAKHFPYLEEDRLKAALADLGESFAAADIETRTNDVERLEKDSEDLFAQLRSLVYYGYYASSDVTSAIQRRIPAGRDYHGPPLPYGYLHCIEDWDETALATAGKGAGYVKTEDVARVDLSKLTWLRAQQNEENAK